MYRKYPNYQKYFRKYPKYFIMIVERLKQYIDSKNITISAFEKSIGMGNASFGRSLKNNGAIGTDKLEKILNVYPDISPEWILTGSGTMLKKTTLNLQPEDQETLRELYDKCFEELLALKQKLNEKDKQVSDLIKTNLYLLEREKDENVDHENCSAAG